MRGSLLGGQWLYCLPLRPNDLGYQTFCVFPWFFDTYKLGASKCKKLFIFGETRYSELFEIADYEYELTIQKLKMADALWQIRIKKLLDLDKTGWRFSGSPITDFRLKLVNLKWWIQYSKPKCKKLLDSDGVHLNNTWFVSSNGIFIIIMYFMPDHIFLHRVLRVEPPVYSWTRCCQIMRVTDGL